MEETSLLYTAGVVALASSSPTHYKYLIFAAPAGLSENVGALLRAMWPHEECTAFPQQTRETACEAADKSVEVGQDPTRQTRV